MLELHREILVAWIVSKEFFLILGLVNAYIASFSLTIFLINSLGFLPQTCGKILGWTINLSVLLFVISKWL